MRTICLNMIVRNEARVIRRCLDSVLPHIHSWAILDTGSTDGTQGIIREHLKDLPGELAEAEWTDFGTARTQALARVGGRADVILFMDADDVLDCPQPLVLPEPAADAYLVRFQLAGPGSLHTYRRIALVSSRLPWRFEGVLHEHLACDLPYRVEALEGPVIRASADGNRGAGPEKYRRDAQVLEAALEKDPLNTRNVFYLAQSYRDAGMPGEALRCYLRRAAMGGWDEEVWVALFEAARAMERLGRPDGEVVHAYLRAYDHRPSRAESLCCLARFHRLRGAHHAACLFAERAAATPRPSDILFLDESFYGWRCLDEASLAYYWTGRHRESADACRKLLEGEALPGEERPRVALNLDLALRAMGAAPGPSSP